MAGETLEKNDIITEVCILGMTFFVCGTAVGLACSASSCNFYL